MKKLWLLLAALVAAPAFGQTASVRWELRIKGTTAPLGTYTTQTACDTAARARNVTAVYECPRLLNVTGTAPVVCAPAPAASSTSTSAACPSGQTGGPIVTTTTTTYTRGAAPACTLTAAPDTTVSGTCTPVVTDPPPTTSGPTYYFSDCQEGAAAGCVPGSNANPGTSASAPKQNLAGFNVNTVPAGTRLLFNRGGAWTGFRQVVENRNATAANPLVFDAYGAGPLPVLKSASENTFILGGNWQNTSDDGGYVFRNLKLDGMGTAQWGFWFLSTVKDVIVENVEITGYNIGVNSNDSADHGVTGIVLRNNHIHRNRAMGMLGHYNNIVIEGNLFEANNFRGSTFDHGTYLGGGRNVTFRNNRYVRNSVVDGQCTGGNMTFHGQMEGLLIEGNVIEQDSAAQSCWLMSITRGYSTAEWFRNVVVRNNVLKNGGQGMVAQSAPGILIEGNVAINANLNIGSGSTAENGSDTDSNAVVRNNTICARSGTYTVAVNSPGAVVTGNVTRTGADASSGVCAR